MKPTNPAATPGPNQVAMSQTEYVRVAGAQQITGLKRSTLYRLLNQGVIKGARLPITGRKSGIRVFDMGSIRRFINKHLQKGANRND